jgi:hypothetical protein
MQSGRNQTKTDKMESSLMKINRNQVNKQIKCTILKKEHIFVQRNRNYGINKGLRIEFLKRITFLVLGQIGNHAISTNLGIVLSHRYICGACAMEHTHVGQSVLACSSARLSVHMDVCPSSYT